MAFPHLTQRLLDLGFYPSDIPKLLNVLESQFSHYFNLPAIENESESESYQNNYLFHFLALMAQLNQRILLNEADMAVLLNVYTLYPEHSAIDKIVTPIINFITQNAAIITNENNALLNKILMCLVQSEVLTNSTHLLLFLNFFKDYSEKVNFARRIALLDIFPALKGRSIPEKDLKKYLVFINRYYENYSEESKLDWLNHALSMIVQWAERLPYNKRTFELLLTLSKKLHTLEGDRKNNYRAVYEQVLPQVLEFIAANPVTFRESDAGLLNYILSRFNDDQKPLKLDNIILFLEFIKKSGHLFTELQHTELWRIYEPTLNNAATINQCLLGALDPRCDFGIIKNHFIEAAKKPAINDEQVAVLSRYVQTPEAEEFQSCTAMDNWETDRARRMNLQVLLNLGYIQNTTLLDQFCENYKTHIKALLTLSETEKKQEQHLLSGQVSTQLLSLAAELQEIYAYKTKKTERETSSPQIKKSLTIAHVTPQMKSNVRVVAPENIQHLTYSFSTLLTDYRTKTESISNLRNTQAATLQTKLTDQYSYLDIINTLWSHKHVVISEDHALNQSSWFRKRYQHNRKGHSRYYQLINHMINEVIISGMQNDPQGFHVYLSKFKKQITQLRFNLIALLNTLEIPPTAYLVELGLAYCDNTDTIGMNLDNGNITPDELAKHIAATEIEKLPGHAQTLVNEFIDALRLSANVNQAVSKQKNLACK